MCTAVFMKNKSALFGRNLDLEYHYEEKITFVPRNFPLVFKNFSGEKEHFSIIGTAIFEKGFPLFYDGMNEHGLCAAGLNFPGEAVYLPEREGFYNSASFELIPRILGFCKNLREAKAVLEKTNITDRNFSERFSATPLHWIFADKTGCIAAEPLGNGLKISENPVGVLANSPDFEFQMKNLENYLNVSPCEPENRFSEKIKPEPYSRGMGGIGLPGDFSSASRFIRAAFANCNSVSEGAEVSQFFHVLGYAEQINGCVRLPGGKLEKTVYSNCFDLEKGICYWKTYENSRIRAVDMRKENPCGDEIKTFPMFSAEDIEFLN